MAGLQADNDIVADLTDAQRDEVELEKKAPSSSDRSSHEIELDGVHDGLEFPTEEEKNTLRRVSDKLPLSAYCESHQPRLSSGAKLTPTSPLPSDRVLRDG